MRFWLHGLVYALGFLAPWDRLLQPGARGPNAHTWGLLSTRLFQTGSVSIVAAFNVLLGIGIVAALAAAALRTWAGAYLGESVVQAGSLHAGVVADGPYRYLRNPLYWGVWFHTLALALLMPVSGAIFALVAVVVLDLRLIGAEEAFLTQREGPAYGAYLAKVPRLLPTFALRGTLAVRRPHWGQAFLGEIYMWGVALSFCFLGWQYDARLLIQAVLISFGLYLVVRAVFPPKAMAAA